MARTRKPQSAEQSIQARLALREAAEQGRLTWTAGVRQIRHALGMTQREFGRAFSLTVRQIQELESGVANPTVATLLRVAKPLGLTIGLIPAVGEDESV
jgi:DNA-binding transcriptional regulator YiaG